MQIRAFNTLLTSSQIQGRINEVIWILFPWRSHRPTCHAPAADTHTFKVPRPGMVPWWGCRWNKRSPLVWGGSCYQKVVPKVRVEL